MRFYLHKSYSYQNNIIVVVSTFMKQIELLIIYVFLCCNTVQNYCQSLNWYRGYLVKAKNQRNIYDTLSVVLWHLRLMVKTANAVNIFHLKIESKSCKFYVLLYLIVRVSCSRIHWRWVCPSRLLTCIYPSFLALYVE